MYKKKHILYCRPMNKLFNWEKIDDLKYLPVILEKYGRVKVTFEKYVPMKSLEQMGYYRAGILPFLEKTLFDDTGMTSGEWHEVLKDKFGLRKRDASNTFDIIVSLADYKESEMSFFIKQIIEWVLHFFQIDIPKPKKIDEYI